MNNEKDFSNYQKADFHIHTKEDQLDKFVELNAKETINYCSKLKYKVIAITNHNNTYYNKELKEYAKTKGIILIPGMEATIDNKHVIILDTNKEDKPKTFDDLYKLKEENKVIIAPHPYFKFPGCLGKEVEKNIELWDALEYNAYYLNWLNLNKKAIKISKKYKIPIVGNSDAHFKFQLNKTYTKIKSSENKEEVLENIRQGNCEVKTKPMKFKEIILRITKSL